MADTKSFVTLNIGSQAREHGGVLGDIRWRASPSKIRFDGIACGSAADASRIAQLSVAVNELTEKLQVKKQLVRYAISGQSVFFAIRRSFRLDG